MDNKPLITIAFDGFSSSGKSTMAKSLAKRIGYAYIDTGAMYRAVTLYCIEHNLFDGQKLDTEELKRQMPDIRITFQVEKDGKSVTCLNGRNVEKEIRMMPVSSKVSIVAAVPFVRHALVRQQQEMGKNKGIVMDGRDIGTVVFPDAEMKVYVNASPETRARRRYDELKAKGDTTTTYEDVYKNVCERDYIDSHREETPLRKADDAIELDNSDMTIEEQDKWLMGLYERTISNLKRQ